MTTHPTGPGRQIPTIAEHYETGAWGTSGDITGADCACGEVFTGPGAVAQLAQHIQTPGPADAVHCPSDGPGIDPIADLDAELDRHAAGIGEPAEHSAPPLPRLGEVLRDAERLIRCALVVLDRTVDPKSMPTGKHGHLADALFETAGFHLEAAMRDLGTIAALPLPAVGSAVPVPRPVRDEDPGSLPVGVAPVAPGRGVGPGVLGPS